MAIIYTYPQISTLSLSDSVLITDNVTQDPAKRTKQATVQQLKTLINGSPLSLTTAGTSGEATLSSGNVLNVPNYSSGGGTVGPGTSGNVSIFSGPTGSSSTIGNSVMSQHAGNDGSNFNDEYFKIEGTGGIWTGNIQLGGTGGAPAGDGALIDYQGSKGGDGQVLTSTGSLCRWEDASALQIGTFTNNTTTLNVGGNLTATSSNNGTTVELVSNALQVATFTNKTTVLNVGGSITATSSNNGATVELGTNYQSQITAKRIPFVDSAGELQDSNLEYFDSTETKVRNGSFAVINGGVAVKDGLNSKVTIEGPGAGTPADYVIKLPNAPTVESQYLGAPKTLGSSPYQLEWINLPISAITGTSPISVTGSGSAKVVSITSPIPVADGGTGLVSINSGQIPRGNGTNAVTADSSLVYNNTSKSLSIRGSGNQDPSGLGATLNIIDSQGPSQGSENCISLAPAGGQGARAININLGPYNEGIKVLRTNGVSGYAMNFTQSVSGTTNVGSITMTNSATAFNTSSDYRLKENVVEMTGSVDRVKQLKPSRFNFISETDSDVVDGFLAHEVSSIIPEAIHGEKDAVDDQGNPIYQGIDQSKLVPLLVGAIKELTARIEALEA